MHLNGQQMLAPVLGSPDGGRHLGTVELNQRMQIISLFTSVSLCVKYIYFHTKKKNAIYLGISVYKLGGVNCSTDEYPLEGDRSP